MDLKSVDGRFVRVMSPVLPGVVAGGLAEEFVSLRFDAATGATNSSAGGRLVERFVQALQHLEEERFEERPDVDRYLRTLESRTARLTDDLRICGARVARALYAVRNKRDVVHVGPVDSSKSDLRYCLAAATWLMAELVRQCAGGSMDEAAAVVAEIERPVTGVIEQRGEKKLVLAGLPVAKEILVLLNSHYPDPVPRRQLHEWMGRTSPASVGKRLGELYNRRLVEEWGEDDSTLTEIGLAEAQRVLRDIAA
ncbi:MAG: hypothetical protein GKS06_13345 [Acidobacteria bacterium]|nr:hypothetical protein [Acidobacteriota bacterium]